MAKCGRPLKDLTGMTFGRLTVLRRGPNRGTSPAWICSCECGTSEFLASGGALRSLGSISCGCVRKDRRLWGCYRFALSAGRVQAHPVLRVLKIRINLIRKRRCRRIGYSVPRERGRPVDHTLEQRLRGQRYGRLTIRSVHGTPHQRTASCRCACGAEKDVQITHLRRGKTLSCGCLTLEVLSGGAAPTHVMVFGEEMSMGELGVLSGRRPLSIWARMRRGASVEDAAFGRTDIRGPHLHEVT